MLWMFLARFSHVVVFRVVSIEACGILSPASHVVSRAPGKLKGQPAASGSAVLQGFALALWG